VRSTGEKEFCEIHAYGEELLKMAITKLGLCARAYDRILKVSRTIANLVGTVAIRPEHVSEAIQHRSLDRNLWMGCLESCALLFAKSGRKLRNNDW